MKIFIALLLMATLQFLFINRSTYAEAFGDNEAAIAISENDEPPSDPEAQRGGRHSKGKPIKSGKSSRNPSILKGHCTVIESAQNPFAQPCSDLLLKLKDSNGIEIQTRTKADGDFEFIASKDKTYSIKSGSASYTVVSPKEPIHGTRTIDLKLQQK